VVKVALKLRRTCRCIARGVRGNPAEQPQALTRPRAPLPKLPLRPDAKPQPKPQPASPSLPPPRRKRPTALPMVINTNITAQVSRTTCRPTRRS